MLIVNPPVHPGEILREDFLVPLGLSAGRLARALGVPRTRIERLVREETSLTADTAMRLGKYFATSPDFWMNIRASYDVSVIHADGKLEAALAAIEPLARSDPEGEVA
jgi:antitoxin HigA-1